MYEFQKALNPYINNLKKVCKFMYKTHKWCYANNGKLVVRIYIDYTTSLSMIRERYICRTKMRMNFACMKIL